jgi:transketolase
MSTSTRAPELAPLATGPVKSVATRNAYGEALLALGKERDDVLVLEADLSGSTKTKAFGKAFPDRFFNIGVAEANMMGTAAGLASQGFTVFASSFAMFATGKAWEQVRQSICVPDLDVKIAATHAGLTVGEDGKSHQMLEDVTLMRVLPHMKVLVACDAVEAAQCVRVAAATPGPVYLRFSRANTPVVFDASYRFQLGKGAVLRDGGDLAIATNGVTTAAALEAAERLAKKGIEARVLALASVVPLDEELVLAAARDCGALLTVEEHQVNGALGSAIAELVSEHHPVPVLRHGMRGEFGQSGTAEELLAHYGLDAAGIERQAHVLLERKKR